MNTLSNILILSCLLIFLSHSISCKKNHLQISLQNKDDILENQSANSNSGSVNLLLKNKNSTTEDECLNLFHFTHTFEKANNQLINIVNKFKLHKHIYTDLIQKYEKDGKDNDADSLKEKEKNNVNFYIEKIGEIQTYIDTIITEIQENLSVTCKEKMKEYSDKMKENITSTLALIK